MCGWPGASLSVVKAFLAASLKRRLERSIHSACAPMPHLARVQVGVVLGLGLGLGLAFKVGLGAGVRAGAGVGARVGVGHTNPSPNPNPNPNPNPSHAPPVGWLVKRVELVGVLLGHGRHRLRRRAARQVLLRASAGGARDATRRRVEGVRA